MNKLSGLITSIVLLKFSILSAYAAPYQFENKSSKDVEIITNTDKVTLPPGGVAQINLEERANKNLFSIKVDGDTCNYATEDTMQATGKGCQYINATTEVAKITINSPTTKATTTTPLQGTTPTSGTAPGATPPPTKTPQGATPTSGAAPGATPPAPAATSGGGATTTTPGSSGSATGGTTSAPGNAAGTTSGNTSLPPDSTITHYNGTTSK
jgi:hypothetical protein